MYREVTDRCGGGGGGGGSSNKTAAIDYQATCLLPPRSTNNPTNTHCKQAKEAKGQRRQAAERGQNPFELRLVDLVRSYFRFSSGRGEILARPGDARWLVMDHGSWIRDQGSDGRAFGIIISVTLLDHLHHYHVVVSPVLLPISTTSALRSSQPSSQS
jgi:hypothetical protein